MTTTPEPPTEPGQPVPCQRCGQPHARCSAHRRDGQPCTQRPMLGQRVCRMHGGKSPGAVERAAERRATAEAEAALGELWPGLAGAEPLRDPIELLQRTATTLEVMADRVGARVNAITGEDPVAGSPTALRAQVVLLDKLLDKILRASEGLARLNLAERQIELAAGQAELVVGAARAMLAELDLLPADRDRAVRAFLAALGRGAQVVVGELEGVPQ